MTDVFHGQFGDLGSLRSRRGLGGLLLSSYAKSFPPVLESPGVVQSPCPAVS